MKTKVAMAISFAGVLVAGSAAALVNTQVLGSTGSNASPLVVDDVAQAQQTLPTLPVTTTVTVPTTAAPTAPTTVAAEPAAAVAPTQAIYAIGDAGTVTLDTAGDRLTIIAVAPAAGWVVTKQEPEDANNVEVKLQSGTTELEFHANLQFGVVTPSVEAKDVSATASSVDDDGHRGGDDDGGRHGGDDD